MKLITALRISLLVIILGFSLASCASSQRPVARTSVPEHCAFQPHRKTTNKKAKRTESPPARTTPIGGNFRVRS